MWHLVVVFVGWVLALPLFILPAFSTGFLNWMQILNIFFGVVQGLGFILAVHSYERKHAEQLADKKEKIKFYDNLLAFFCAGSAVSGLFAIFLSISILPNFTLIVIYIIAINTGLYFSLICFSVFKVMMFCVKGCYEDPLV